MDGLIGQSDGIIRLAVFAGVFLVMALIELVWPKRKLIVSKRKRWLTNIGISVAGTLLLRLMAMLAVPIAAIAAAFYAQAHQIGLLNQVAWPQWLKVVVALLALDSRHLGAAFGLAQDRDVLAPAPGASRRPRHRRDHGGALSPGRDRTVDAVEDRGGGAARRLAAGGVSVRGDPQRLRHVQPRQYRAAGLVRPRSCGCSSSRPTCIACITRCSGASTIPITASICRFGIGCFAPTPRSPRRGIKA